MQLRRLRPWILLAAVLIGQWLAVAHASEHAVLQSDVSCAYCISGAGPALLPVTAAAALTFTSLHPAPPFLVVAVAGRPVLGPAHIRGPPFFVS